MQNPAFRQALLVLKDCFSNQPLDWALTGSLSAALQGLPFSPGDIDLKTDAPGAYRIQELLAQYVTRPVGFQEGERIRSHFGALEIAGTRVEIIGESQFRGPSGAWTAPVCLAEVRRWAHCEEGWLPVVSVAYEAETYALLGRAEKAALLRAWVEAHPEDCPEAISNYTRVDARLASGGMPLPGQLAALARAGFQEVVNLAMPHLPTALPDEARRAAELGMAYHSIPVEWEDPRVEDLRRFLVVMDAARDRRVFVHCVLNMRASAFLYLYRVLREGAADEAAQPDLLRAWQPNPTWSAFIAQARLEMDGGPVRQA
jgi:protein tyrosine phosphatase (PTP) superfamily phosphohydrolase (DUF442 family)